MHHTGLIILLFLYFKHEYIRPLHLLMVLFQMLDIPWLRQFPPVQRLKMIVTLPGIMDDFVGYFPGWANHPLGRVLDGRCDFALDEVSNIKSSKLHPFVVILGHLLLVFHHLVGCNISSFVQAIQVDS